MPPDSLQNLHNEVLALQSALEASENGFIRFNDDETIFCDSTVRALLGVKLSSSLSDLPDFLYYLEESQHEAFLDAIDTAKTSGKSLELDLRLENGAREDRLVLRAQATQLPGVEGPTICGIISKIESTTQSDEMLQKAQSSNVELANFASIASHDMREPLRMITSYLRLLQERSPEALDDRARRYIDYACEGADRMRALIEDLLSYARLDTSNKEFEALDLGDILDTSIDNLHAIIKETKAEVTVAIDHAPIAMGDKVRLVRLFQNLITNGIKFKKPDSRARVEISFKDGDHRGIPAKWIVCIKDQGIGIDPDHREMLFDLFQRLNTRDEFEGSGIGLAVCKKIAEQHGGRIWFESEKGNGSTFYVTLEKAAPSSLE